MKKSWEKCKPKGHIQIFSYLTWSIMETYKILFLMNSWVILFSSPNFRPPSEVLNTMSTYNRDLGRLTCLPWLGFCWLVGILFKHQGTSLYLHFNFLKLMLLYLYITKCLFLYGILTFFLYGMLKQNTYFCMACLNKMLFFLNGMLKQIVYFLYRIFKQNPYFWEKHDRKL